MIVDSSWVAGSRGDIDLGLPVSPWREPDVAAPRLAGQDISGSPKVEFLKKTGWGRRRKLGKGLSLLMLSQ